MEKLTEKQESNREIKMDNDILQFVFLKFGSPKETISLKAGPSYITNTYFSGEYPNEGEIEKALNYIEYELTKHKELNNNNEMLVCSNALLGEMLKGEEQSVVTRERMEEIFDKYVDCAYGEPAVILGIDYSSEKLATIILVRSIMYYLKFKEITVSK